jgi:hypothetical protein
MANSSRQRRVSGVRRHRATDAEVTPTYHGPVPLTTLIGRHAELGDARRTVLDPHVRLLTVSRGAPGAGKTHLAHLALVDFLRIA